MNRSDTALIVVDVQNDFVPGGALAVNAGDEVVGIINEMQKAFSCVVLTADWHPEGHVSFASSHEGKNAFTPMTLTDGSVQMLWPDHCVAGTRGADFVAGLETTKACAVIRKGMNAGCDSYSGFIEADRKTVTGLAGFLKARGITRVVVCGLATDFCVSWTALDAAAAGFETYVVEEASRAIDAGGSLAAARQAWIEAGVQSATAAECIAGLS